ncbi:MAG: Thiamine pyrophosphokinase ThiN [Thermacetogenium phaeum]|uniref:Thiamine diphosphokinase n=1 Tax=Thermacetogenium phaeum TaxID=85874 RepID=A0A101FHD6_9THEO|nr:MAG: Thiamine pyrophosphokinase ThiN [Thermacetogenium phaeum]
MRFLIMANGEYGDLAWYRDRLRLFDRVVCADGGAGVARMLGIVPDWIVGDLDSIREEDRSQLERAGVRLEIHPPDKDFTDTHLALELARREGAREVAVWGGTGSRLDHTLCNLFNASRFVEDGIEVRFESPDLTIYLVDEQLIVPGSVGDTVSVLVLGDRATGLTEEGFRYPLEDADLDGRCQYTVSNAITRPHPCIRVATGILAVFHYRSLPE